MNRIYTLSSCCCVYLIISLLSFFQLWPPKFAMPLDLCPFPRHCFTGSVFPHISAVLLSFFLHWRFSSGRDSQMRPLCTKLVERWCLPYECAFLFASTPLFLHYHPSHISSGTAFYTIFTCFNRLPLMLLYTVVHSAFFHPSINYSWFCHLLLLSLTLWDVVVFKNPCQQSYFYEKAIKDQLLLFCSAP